MGIKLAYTRNSLLSCFLALVIFVTGCAQQPSSLPPLERLGFDTWAEIVNERGKKIVQARNNWNQDQTNPTNKIFLDSDPESIPFDVRYYEARLSDTYLSRHEALVVAESWNWKPFPTGESWKEDHPITEFHWIRFSGGVLSQWEVMYGQELHTAASTPLDEQILQDYASAWSSGNPETVAKMYTTKAIRHEPLLWNNRYGSSQIEEFSKDFFSEYPDARLELLQSFGEFPEANHIGGVYAIHLQRFRRTCDVRAVIVLTQDNDKIATEWVFYNAETLIDCGWVR